MSKETKASAFGAHSRSNVDPALWTERAAFGVAGGPIVRVLTDAGNKRAFSVGAQIKPECVDLLIGLNAEGGEALFTKRREGSARIALTDFGRKFNDHLFWGCITAKGYAERFVTEQGDGIRLTDKGRAAVLDGYSEQQALLVRVRQEVQ